MGKVLSEQQVLDLQRILFERLGETIPLDEVEDTGKALVRYIGILNRIHRQLVAEGKALPFIEEPPGIFAAPEVPDRRKGKK